jgi:hypothetical protein
MWQTLSMFDVTQQRRNRHGKPICRRLSTKFQQPETAAVSSRGENGRLRIQAAGADCEAAGSIVVCHQSKVLPICRGKDVHTFKIRFILIITRAFVHNSTRINYYYYCMNIPGSTVVNFAQLWLIKMLTKLKYLGTTKIGRHTLITT